MVDAVIKTNSYTRVDTSDTTWITHYDVTHSYIGGFEHLIELRVPNLNIASDIDDIQTQLIKERL
jgi:hypothetical protein